MSAGLRRGLFQALHEFTGATATTHDSTRPEHIFMPLPSLPARMGDSLVPAAVRPRTDKDGAGRASAGRVHADQAETPVAKKVVALPIQATTGTGKESPRLAAVPTKSSKKVRLPGSRLIGTMEDGE